MRDDALIVWWTSPADCRIIGENLPNAAIPYLVAEYHSRRGRNARGRLWVPIELRSAEIVETHSNAELLMRLENENFGGIVIRYGDSSTLRGLPGFVTTLDLEFVVPKP